ncbi:MAG: cysteine desulfurase family protein, partial [Moraxellaceae bacterium]|nr:cysteine desulfurase family protein [Moraxellaceae bacterium]
EAAREKVANAIGSSPREIIFTGSCTESDNLAIIGSVRAKGGLQRLITTQVEHPAVLESFRQLEREGHKVTYLSTDETGMIRLEELESALKEGVFLTSIMGANNEVGTLQPIIEASKLCKAYNSLLHSDLAQLPSYCKVNVQDLGLDLASFSGHKIYGPKGVGALFIRRRRPKTILEPLSWGGGHEKGLRHGTLNTPLIVGLGEAMKIAATEYNKNAKRASEACDRLWLRLSTAIQDIHLNGHPESRLPNNLSIYIKGIEPLALIRLMRNEVAFSASSACTTESIQASHVLLAMFGVSERANRSFRISTGRLTTSAEADVAAMKLIEAVNKLSTFSDGV